MSTTGNTETATLQDPAMMTDETLQDNTGQVTEDERRRVMNKQESHGNFAKMREALKLASYFLHQHHMGAVYAPDGETMIFCDDVAKAVDAALAAPARNSDIGTAAEQVARFTEVCKSHSRDGARGLCNTDCPFHENEYGSDCALAWGQMPYKEAVRNEQTKADTKLSVNV